MKICLITVEDADFKRDLDKFLEGTVGIVKANSYEYLCIWKEYHETKSWDENLRSMFFGVGYLGDRQITVYMRVAKIDGQKIVFWESPSQLVDHAMIDKWMLDHMPGTARRDHDPEYLNRVDAQNFHNVLR